MHMNQTITSVDVDSMKSSITHWTYIVLFCCFEHKRLVISQWRIQDFPEMGAPNPKLVSFCNSFCRKLFKKCKYVNPAGGCALGASWIREYFHISQIGWDGCCKMMENGSCTLYALQIDE